MVARLHRVPFTTSRALEYFTERELTAQTGLRSDEWPLLIVKELADNSLDACEEHEIAPRLRVSLDGDVVKVADNGPGLPRDILERQLDFTTRTSTNSKYAAPTRGQQGNAIKAILAVPFVEAGDQGHVEVATPEYALTIRVRVDQVREEPVIELQEQETAVRNGTVWRVGWPGLSSALEPGDLAHFLPTLAALNPHLTITGDGLELAASQPKFRKWLPSSHPSAHWYDPDDLASRVAGDLAQGNDPPLRKLVREFHGLASTVKAKHVLETAGLSEARFSDLLEGDSIDQERVAKLLSAMQAGSQPIRPERMGVIGREHFLAALEGLGGDRDTFRYKRLCGTEDGVPYIVEAAFAYRPDEERRELITGINWTPTYRDPFSALGESRESLEGLLGDQYCAWDEPVALIVHLVTPKPRFTDRGKTSLTLGGQTGEAVIQAVQNVVKEWVRQRRSEEREAQARLNRQRRLARKKTKAMEWLEAMVPVMPDAYARTAGTTGIAEARQLMYAARPALQELTGQQLDDKYFSYTLLPRFQREHPELTAAWNVVYDQRGHLIEPHTHIKVPLSTVGVRRYLRELLMGVPSLPVHAPLLSTNVPTAGPVGRFQGIVFSEKEGMLPILQRASVPERFDVALMTTKGNTVTAARELVDALTAELLELGLDLPIIVLHDFDTMGLTILSTFLKSTERYTYKTGLKVIDAGLRLEQALEMGLQDETVVFPRKKNGGYKTPKPETLRANTASDEEIEFLIGDGREGRRIELNSMLSDQFVEVVETTLVDNGLKEKVVPDQQTLTRTYREMVAIHTLNEAVQRLAGDVAFADITVPADLRRRVTQALRKRPQISWDRALSELALKAANGKAPTKSGAPALRVI